MAPIQVARELVEIWTGQTVGLDSNYSPVMLQHPDYIPVPTADPLPQGPLVADFSLLSGQSAGAMQALPGIAPSSCAQIYNLIRVPAACKQVHEEPARHS